MAAQVENIVIKIMRENPLSNLKVRNKAVVICSVRSVEQMARTIIRFKINIYVYKYVKYVMKHTMNNKAEEAFKVYKLNTCQYF